MRKPLDLNGEGFTLGLVAPSSPVTSELVKNATAFFEGAGFSVKLGAHILKRELYAAGKDEDRASDIMAFFEDSDVTHIVTLYGGTCSIRTLPLLDFEVIRSNPKPIIGYSDATSLQMGIYAKTGCVSFSGFNCSDIKDGSVDSVIAHTLGHCLRGENYSITGRATVHSGSVTAPLIGGNLTCLMNLMGTPYQPDFSGKVLLLEDVGIEPYLVEGLLSQLHVAGVFRQSAGLIFGEFLECTAKHFPNQKETVQDVIDFWCNRINVPCIKDFPYGHSASRSVLPLGQNVTLDAANATVSVDFTR